MISTIAFLTGIHLIHTNLYNHHPLIEFNKSLVIFQNSFEEPVLGIYKTYNLNNFKLRIGLLQGYRNYYHYKNQIYKLPYVTKDGTCLLFVPSYEINNFLIAILGDSVNIGFKVDL